MTIVLETLWRNEFFPRGVTSAGTHQVTDDKGRASQDLKDAVAMGHRLSSPRHLVIVRDMDLTHPGSKNGQATVDDIL